MPASSSSDQPTEMEGMVLALLHRDGPLTAYEIKEVFRGSPSSFWSGSAGAVYPLVKRLEGRGILSSKDVSETKRPRREFSLTDHGRDLMRSWLMDVDRAIDMGYDPLRTRMQFVGMLEDADRETLFASISERIPTPIPPAPGVGTSDLHRLWLQARLDWFNSFRKIFKR
ncbi:PadR family transcriptional regulator [Maricaulis sp. MIT060901]|uniref:PadR family transcriptional regulator n=1 Tax=Maricaulis sp. MIT060901 TaxID=3096993 RepID=UPI00399C1A4E